MNKSHLVSCAGCARHVRASEAICPFCRSELPQALRGSLPRRPPPPRLSRAALFALGTGAATIATACGGSVDSGGTPQQADGGTDSGDAGVAEPAYGGSHIFDSGTDTGSAALYGGIFPGDASVGSLDAGAPEDASEVDASQSPDTGFAPPYGQPPTPPPPPPDEP